MEVAQETGDATARPRQPTPAGRAVLVARPAARHELRRIAALLRETIATHPSYSPAHRAFEIGQMRAAALEEIWRESPDNIMVGESDGVMAGFAITKPENGIGWVRWGVAFPQFRRTGVTPFVMDAMIARYRERGFTKLCSVTRTDNRPAIALLKQKRFRVACEMRRHWFGEDFLYWERLLDAGDAHPAATAGLPLPARLLIRARHGALDLADRFGATLRRTDG